MDCNATTLAGQQSDDRTDLAPLTRGEQRALVDCEAVIERGLKSFRKVALALQQIRDRKLYRDQYGTFDEYVRERWGFSDSRARQYIAAAKVAEKALTVTNVTVPNEATARALNSVPEEHQAEVLIEADKRTGGKPTAAVVKQVAAEITAPVVAQVQEDVTIDEQAPRKNPPKEASVTICARSDEPDSYQMTVCNRERGKSIGKNYKFTADPGAWPYILVQAAGRLRGEWAELPWQSEQAEQRLHVDEDKPLDVTEELRVVVRRLFSLGVTDAQIVTAFEEIRPDLRADADQAAAGDQDQEGQP
jgi:hypothetical protein